MIRNLHFTTMTTTTTMLIVEVAVQTLTHNTSKVVKYEMKYLSKRNQKKEEQVLCVFHRLVVLVVPAQENQEEIIFGRYYRKLKN